MLPKSYRTRYALFLTLSIALHIAVAVFLLWVPDSKQAELAGKKTVEVKLKNQQDSKSAAKQKKSEEKKSEKKQSEEESQSKSKKAEEQKEVKKAEPKQKQKKQEQKKQEQKKQEANKQEAKKQEAKKQEAKKQEAKKQEAKKQEAKKQAQRSERDKPKPQTAKPQEKQPTGGSTGKANEKPAQSNDLNKNAQPNNNVSDQQSAERLVDKNSLAYWTEKWGSGKNLNDREMMRTVIVSSGFNTRFTDRDLAGKRKVESLSRLEYQIFNQDMNRAFQKILQYYVSPQNDSSGRKLNGKIRFLIDESGAVSEINVALPSGNNALDQAFVEAVRLASPLPLPADPKVREAFIVMPKALTYDETDL